MSATDEIRVELDEVEVATLGRIMRRLDNAGHRLDRDMKALSERVGPLALAATRRVEAKAKLERARHDLDRAEAELAHALAEPTEPASDG